MMYYDFMLHVFNTFINTMLFSVLIYKCTENSYTKKVYKFIIYFFCTLTIGQYIKLYIDNDFFVLVVYHIFQLGITFFVYGKKNLNPLIAFSFGYYILFIYSNINLGINEYLILIHSASKFGEHNFFDVIVILTIILLCIEKKDKIKNIIKSISEDKILTILFMCGTLICDIFIGVFYFLSYIKVLLTLCICILMIIIVNYLVKFINKANTLDKLNREIERKNDELRKIKHDYGAQISYLYGLFLLQRWGNLKESIDKIININESTSSSAIVDDNLENSVLRDAFEPILNKGIHLIIEENTHLNDIDIDKNELLKIISEVGDLLSDLICERGMILVKSYTSRDNIIINMECISALEEEISKNNIIIDKVRNKFVNVNKVIIENGGRMIFKRSHISTKIKISFKYNVSV